MDGEGENCSIILGVERPGQIDRSLNQLRESLDNRHITSVTCDGCGLKIYCASKFPWGALNSKVEKECVGIDASGNPVEGVSCAIQETNLSSS